MIRIRPRSFKNRITVLYTLLVGLILAMYSAVLFFALWHLLHKDIDSTLKEKAWALTTAIEAYREQAGSTEPLLVSMRKVTKLEFSSRTFEKLKVEEGQWFHVADHYDLAEDYILFFQPDGTLLVSSPNVTDELVAMFRANVPKGKKKGAAYFKTLIFQDHRLRTLRIPVRLAGNEQYILVIADSLSGVFGILSRRLLGIMISFPFVLLFTSFLGGVFADRVLGPVKKIAETAEGITRKSLERRVELEDVDEEIKFLAEAFNRMIERLEKSFLHIGEFSSHVAHELKTPLAIIRGDVQVTLKSEQDSGEYKRVLEETLYETSRMLRVIDDLLIVSRFDYEPNVFQYTMIDVRTFLADIFEKARILASEKKLDLLFENPETKAVIRGDDVHLRRLFFNLINNAIKFTPSGGQIRLSSEADAERIRISVRDSGPGIPEKDLPRVFERFFRGRQVADGMPGSGLGLAISEIIVRAHHGTIQVESKPGEGTCFTVTLPRAENRSGQ